VRQSAARNVEELRDELKRLP